MTWTLASNSAQKSRTTEKGFPQKRKAKAETALTIYVGSILQIDLFPIQRQGKDKPFWHANDYAP